MDPETSNIFVFGVCVLFGWMIVILICASPQLFRDLIKRGCCTDSAEKQGAEKIRKAEARLKATRILAEKPSALLLEQVMVMSSTSEANQNSESIPLNLVEVSSLHEASQAGPSIAGIHKTQ